MVVFQLQDKKQTAGGVCQVMLSAFGIVFLAPHVREHVTQTCRKIAVLSILYMNPVAWSVLFRPEGENTTDRFDCSRWKELEARLAGVELEPLLEQGDDLFLSFGLQAKRL